MTQTLVGFNKHGLVMASDSRATRITPTGGREYFSVEKLFPLGQYTGIVSGGSGVSIPLTLALCQQVRQRRLLAIEDILDFAVPYLTTGYRTYLDTYGPEPHPELRRLNFILAGYSLTDPEEQYQIFLVESENNRLPFKVTPVKPLLVMPRNLGVEIKFFRALQQQAPLPELLRICHEFLLKMASLQEEIGPPFYFAVITRAGYRPVTPPFAAR